MSDLSTLLDVVRREGGYSRRTFLAYGTALASLPWLAERTQGKVLGRASFASDPFTLGVASGDPSSSGVVLWTRLAPKPLEPGGGMPAEIIEVQYEIADDEAFKTVVQRGTAVATPQLGHSVHVEAEGLKPDRWYWYRFKAGDAESKVGRTRTLPAKDAKPESLKFAFASCQHFETGLFTAYEHMIKDDLDLVFHLGDYIYEYGGIENRVRKHIGKEIESLEDYRIRHSQYRSDPLLHGAHAKCPWFVTWDDHEVDNNYAGDISQDKGVSPEEVLARRANAYQAYYEMMPLRKRSLPRGPHLQLYRNASYGRLAEVLLLDTRQYRTDQPNGDGGSEINPAALDSKNSLLGKSQNGWLKSKLLDSAGTWNILAQQVMMGMVDHAPGDRERYSMDQWPGAAHERIELMRFMADRRVPNPVVLTGDIHSSWANEIRVDDRNQKTPVVATEFVGTSISSGGNGSTNDKRISTVMTENPFVKFLSLQRGYVRCTVTPGNWKSDYIVIEDVLKPGAPAITRASFVVEAGKPGLQKA